MEDGRVSHSTSQGQIAGIEFWDVLSPGRQQHHGEEVDAK